MNVNNLVEECETYVSSLNFWQQLNYKLKHYKDFIKSRLKEEINTDEFIKVCDNRIDYAKAFFQNAATLLGFSIAGLAIVLTISGLERNENHVDVFLDWLIKYLGNIILPITVFSLTALIIYFVMNLIYDRANIRAWVAFKEEVILKRKAKIESSAF